MERCWKLGKDIAIWWKLHFFNKWKKAWLQGIWEKQFQHKRKQEQIPKNLLCFISEIHSFAEVVLLLFISLENFICEFQWLCDVWGKGGVSFCLLLMVSFYAAFIILFSEDGKNPWRKCSPAVNIYCSVCLASIGVFQKPL